MPLLLDWHADPLVIAGLTTTVAGYLLARGAARRNGAAARPAGDRWFAGAVAALVVALCSPVAARSETTFSVHMVQHLLLLFAAAPMLVLAAPVTLALQAAGRARRRNVLRLLHSRVTRAAGHPVVTWCVFAAVMYATHFSPLYDAALGNAALHGLEHVLYLGAATLFWLPIVRRDPVTGSFPWPARLLYLFLALPLQSLLGLAIYSSDEPLYPHYLALGNRADVLADQHLAGAIMWVGGDVCMLAALLLAVRGWAAAETREGARLDAALDAAAAARAANRDSSAQ